MMLKLLSKEKIIKKYLELEKENEELKENFEKLKLSVLKLALNQAIEKFEATFERTGIQRYVIKSYQEIGGTFSP
mgnify:CR=1 FL=1